jgi:hypothetical protein
MLELILVLVLLADTAFAIRCRADDERRRGRNFEMM